jgi:hypothetical protein
MAKQKSNKKCERAEQKNVRWPIYDKDVQLGDKDCNWVDSPSCSRITLLVNV